MRTVARLGATVHVTGRGGLWRGRQRRHERGERTGVSDRAILASFTIVVVDMFMTG